MNVSRTYLFITKCCKCKATYSSWTYLRKHMEDYTSDIYLECDECELQSESSEKLGNHMKRKRVKFRCEECRL